MSLAVYIIASEHFWDSRYFKLCHFFCPSVCFDSPLLMIPQVAVSSANFAVHYGAQNRRNETTALYRIL